MHPFSSFFVLKIKIREREREREEHKNTCRLLAQRPLRKITATIIIAATEDDEKNSAKRAKLGCGKFPPTRNV
jgi:hypothetical protein